MKKELHTIKYLVLILVIAACSSGKQAYERGDYYESVLKSVQRLRKNPDHKKSSEALRGAYPLAVDYLLSNINSQVTSEAPFKWKNAVGGYQKLNHMYEEILRAPGAKKVISTPRSFYKELAEVKEKAAKESYDAGIAAMMSDSREDAKKAYFHFKEANKYVPGYKEVADMTAQAKDAATLKVVIDQIPVPGRYSLSGDFFQDKIEGYLRNYERNNQFVKFFTPMQSQEVATIHQVLKIQFDDFLVGNEYISKETVEYKQDSVEVGTVKLEDGTTQKVYGTVKAKLTSFKKEVKSSGLLSMQVLDADSDAVIKHEKIEGVYVWKTTWGNYNGDSRALSKAQLDMCNRKEARPPNNQTMFRNFSNPIYNKLTPKMKSFYDRY